MIPARRNQQGFTDINCNVLSYTAVVVSVAFDVAGFDWNCCKWVHNEVLELTELGRLSVFNTKTFGIVLACKLASIQRSCAGNLV